MFVRIAVISSLVMLASATFAETCPSVADIKKNRTSGWKVYDSAEDTPLTAKRMAYFKKHVAQFALAEWSDVSKNHGAIHCYYHDKDGSDFEAYLIKKSFAMPKTGKNDWYQVSGSKHCAAGSELCKFQQILPHTQLAKR